MAIISHNKPRHVADFLGYQSLIIRALRVCCKGKWVTYNCYLNLTASTSHINQWSSIDMTLLNISFPDNTNTNLPELA